MPGRVVMVLSFRLAFLLTTVPPPTVGMRILWFGVTQNVAANDRVARTSAKQRLDGNLKEFAHEGL